MQINSSLSQDLPLPSHFSRRFLIQPWERVQFALRFVLATGIGWLTVAIVLRPLQNPELPALWQEGGVLGTFVSGFVSGTIVGATQWFVLRRYIPDWLWILANTTGYVVAMTTLWAWRELINHLINRAEPFTWLAGFPPQTTVIVLSGLGMLLTVLCTIWLGLAQWLVLRQYARPSWGWLFVPAIAVVVSSSCFLLQLGLNASGKIIPLDMTVLAAGVLGTTQAIGLCVLYQRISTGQSLMPHAALKETPEILGYSRVRAIAAQLRQQIDQNWQKEITGDRPLIYIVATTSSGSVVTCEPSDRVARDAVDLTPLPDLVNATTEAIDTTTPLAWFRVFFLPSGRLKVLPRRGLPLTLLTVLLLILVVATSAAISVGRAYVEVLNPV